MRILHVVGARPNFVKAAAVVRALANHPVGQSIVHTGQHYDAVMSQAFFDQLGLPSPDVNLEVGSSSHAVQTAQIMMRLEPVLLDARPDWVLVYGDVNSTLASALVAAKLLVPIAHVEAGLRSRDDTMPEEINRRLTDQLATLLFTPSADADDNLRREGIPDSRIRFVGNVMIDTLERLLPQAAACWPAWQQRLPDRGYMLVTLHRPSNVDDGSALGGILRVLGTLSSELPILFPMHPRTRARIDGAGLAVPTGVTLVEPLAYLDFLALQQHAAIVLTDSGGVQEETTHLGIPCITLRASTERPITVTMGTNTVIGNDLERLQAEVRAVLRGERRPHSPLPLWDGRAGERIARALVGQV